MDIELTEDEKKAIRKLKAIAKTFPKSLWLFSASGTLCVMKKGSDGKSVMMPGDGGQGKGGGVDPDFHVDTIDIENDGGDW